MDDETKNEGEIGSVKPESPSASDRIGEDVSSHPAQSEPDVNEKKKDLKAIVIVVVAVLVLSIFFLIGRGNEQSDLVDFRQKVITETPIVSDIGVHQEASKSYSGPFNESGEIGRFMNAEWEVDFLYPKEWGELNPYESDDVGKEFGTETVPLVFMTDNNQVAQVAYHVPSRNIVVVERAGVIESISDLPDYARGRGDILSRVIQQKGDVRVERLIGSVPDEVIDYHNPEWRYTGGLFIDVKFSPSGKYVVPQIAVHSEAKSQRVIDIETGEMLFDTIDYGSGPTSISWSDDDQVLVVASYSGANGAPGLDGLLISNYGDVGKTDVVFTYSDLEETGVIVNDIDSPIYDLNYSDIEIHDGVVSFRASSNTYGHRDEESRVIREGNYQFDTKTRVLKQLE